MKTNDMGENAVPRSEPPLSALNGLQHAVDSLEKWQTEDYDGLKGRLPSWVPDQVILDFDGHRYAVYLAVKNKRLTVAQAYSWLHRYIEREELCRLQDDLFQQHRDDEAIELNKRIDSFILAVSLNLHDQFNRLARTYADLKLGQTEALKLWLGEELAQNNRRGKAVREGEVKGGIKGGIERRKKPHRKEIVRIARKLIKQGHPQYGLAPKILHEGDFSLSTRQINYILREEKIR